MHLRARAFLHNSAPLLSPPSSRNLLSTPSPRPLLSLQHANPPPATCHSPLASVQAARSQRRELVHGHINPVAAMSSEGAQAPSSTQAADAQQQQQQPSQEQQPQQAPLVQYVVLRRDLWSSLKWPLGSIVAQACHASTAALQSGLKGSDPHALSYCSDENTDRMHKVVLEIKDEKQLRDLSAKLSDAGIQHKLWVEQPEDFATSLATKPYPKTDVAVHFKKLQLCKASFG